MIKVENLCVSYGENEVLKDVSFDVKDGDYLVIVGENGAGKSTLMKAMLGLIKIDSGSVLVDDKLVGYVPQINSNQRNFPALVKEVILSGLIKKKKFFYNKDDYKKLDDILELLKMSHLKNRRVSELSGGQNKKVMLARALIDGANTLFLDEPTNGLDPVARMEFYNELDRLNEKSHTVVTISHDIRSIIKCAKTVLHLGRNGKGVLFFGNKDEYIKSDLFKVLSGVHEHERFN